MTRISHLVMIAKGTCLRSAVALFVTSGITTIGCGGGSSAVSESAAGQPGQDPTLAGAPPAQSAPPEATPKGSKTPAGFVAYDVNHVLGTGQSLSLGAMGSPPLSVSQPFENVMFDTGLLPASLPPRSFVPLVETATFMEAPVETPSSSLANLVSALSAERYAEPQRVLVSLHGLSGASYPMVSKGTQPYVDGLAQVRGAKAIADGRGLSYVVRAITVVHGESDGWQNWNKEYDKAILEWQATYDADIKAITGQSVDVPMFHTQYSAWTPVESAPTNIIPRLQLEAHKRGQGKVVLVGPKYMLPYAKDGFHLTNEGYRWLGEYYAKAYVRHVLEGGTWEPLRPMAVERLGATVTVRFHVPAPPLVLDRDLVSDPGNFGFEVTDDAGTTIKSVAITGPDVVTITLSGEPRGEERRLRYAFRGDPGNVAGPVDGPRGNLRDSDATASRYGYKLFNWCVHFDEPLP